MNLAMDIALKMHLNTAGALDFDVDAYALKVVQGLQEPATENNK